MPRGRGYEGSQKPPKSQSIGRPPPQKAEPAQPSGIASKKYFWASAALCEVRHTRECFAMSLLEAAMRADRVGASWKENAWRMYSTTLSKQRRAPGDRPTLEVLRRLGCLLLR